MVHWGPREGGREGREGRRRREGRRQLPVRRGVVLGGELRGDEDLGHRVVAQGALADCLGEVGLGGLDAGRLL